MSSWCMMHINLLYCIAAFAEYLRERQRGWLPRKGLRQDSQCHLKRRRNNHGE